MVKKWVFRGGKMGRANFLGTKSYIYIYIYIILLLGYHF